MKKEYDYLIVGAGIFGSVFAYEMGKLGKECLVLDRREHIGGNIYTAKINDIHVHVYGAHIFHTSDKKLWDYVNQFCEFNNYINSPLANYKGSIYNLPFNMNTFSKLWDISTPAQAKKIMEQQTAEYKVDNPQNLEEKALSLVGHDIYEKFIKGYTEKQWGRSCTELPAFIINRLPLRFTYNNNYFNDRYQGIPIGGFTQIIEKMLCDCDVLVNTDYKDFIKDNPCGFEKILYTGSIDEFYDYELGALEYRSLKFDTQELDIDNYQGNAVVNYTDSEVPYTRIVEHKYFEFGEQDNTVISYEYPQEWSKGMEAYYPINDERNNQLYARYLELAKSSPNVIFGGRLGMYKYLDMDKVIELALDMVGKEKSICDSVPQESAV